MIKATNTIYDSYNIELSSKYVKSVKLSNFTKIYSLTNEKRGRGTRRIGPRKKHKTQKGGNLLGTIARLGTKAPTSTGLLIKGLSTGAKAINSDTEKKLVDDEIKHAPELYCLGASKIKNKVASYVVQEAQKPEAENVENLFG